MSEPKITKMERLPVEDGDGYRVEFTPMSFIGYVFRGASMKWATYSQYGQAMTDEIFDNPFDAAEMKGVVT